jgi:hypothetical protein
MRNYGKGRVFYSAFGHFSSSFTLPPVRAMLLKALLWLTGEIEADATPRSGPSAATTALPPDGVRNLAGPNDAFAPGSIVTLAGDRLTSGSSLNAAALPLPVRLAGTHVEVNGLAAPLFSVAPSKLLVQLPANLKAGEPASFIVSSVNRMSNALPLRIEPVVPVIVAAARVAGAVVLYLTGLGSAAPIVRAGGQPAFVFYAGPAPGLAGLTQVNVIAAGGLDANAALELVVEAGGRMSNTYLLEK